MRTGKGRTVEETCNRMKKCPNWTDERIRTGSGVFMKCQRKNIVCRVTISSVAKIGSPAAQPVLQCELEDVYKRQVRPLREYEVDRFEVEVQ